MRGDRIRRDIFIVPRTHLLYDAMAGDSAAWRFSQQGRVAEWFKAPVLKTGRGLRSLVGSNPTPSASVAVSGPENG